MKLKIFLFIFVSIFLFGLVSAGNIDQFNDDSINTTLWNVTERGGGSDDIQEAGTAYLLVKANGNTGSTGDSTVTLNHTQYDIFRSFGGSNITYRMRSWTGHGGGANELGIKIVDNAGHSNTIKEFGTSSGTNEYGSFWKINSTTIAHTFNSFALAYVARSDWGTNITVQFFLHVVPNTADFEMQFDYINASFQPMAFSNMNPTNNLIFNSSNIAFNTSISSDGTLSNATLNVYYLNGTLFFRNTTSITGTTNNTNWTVGSFVPQSYYWNVTACDNINCASSTNNNFTVGAVNGTSSFNSTIYETDNTQSVSTPITILQGYNISSANLIYNGTSYSGTITGIGSNDFRLIRNIDFLTTPGLNNWFWSVNFNNAFQQNMTNNNQLVAPINLTICNVNAAQNVTYMNITFKNETIAQQTVKGSISSTWTYWLSSRSINKTFTYTNTSEQFNYALCFRPSDKNINVLPSVNYYNGESPQRTYAPGTLVLTNSSTNQILWLLPTNDGIYVTFQVINSALQQLQGVDINISRSGVGLIAQSLTDAAGSATFFMSPNFAYTVSAVLSGYPSFLTSITPSQTSYTITLGSTNISTNITDMYQGISTGIAPSNITLSNRTAYNFAFSINSSYWNIDSFGFYLYNSTGSILGSNTSATNGGIVYFNQSTNNDTLIRMNYFWSINGSYANGTRIWNIEDGSQTQWSIKTFGTDLKTYLSGGGLFGMTTTGLNILIFLFIFLAAGIVSLKFGFDNLTAVVGTMVLLSWLFDGLGLITYIDPLPRFATSIAMSLMLIGVIFWETVR